MDDPVFDRRLVLGSGGEGPWLVLGYRLDPDAPPRRPILRALRANGTHRDFVLPGAAAGRGQWLGLIPKDTDEIRLATDPGFVLETVATRSHGSVLRECWSRKPLRCLSALYEGAMGNERRYRDILRGTCAVTPLSGYHAWAAARRAEAAPSASSAGILVLVPAAIGQGAAVARTLAGLNAQTHARWSAIVAYDGGEAQATAQERVTLAAWNEAGTLGDWLTGTSAEAVCLLEPGDVLAPDALSRLVAGLPEADLVYGDETRSDGSARLKPDWSPDFALAGGYVGRPCLVAMTLARRLGTLPLGHAAEFPLRLELAVLSAATGARHVPQVLAVTAGRPADPAARARALDASLAEEGRGPRAALRGGVVDLLWPLPEPAPLVSVVVPSRDRLDLITRVTRGVLQETVYPAIELVVVDNGSTEPEVLALYEGLRRDPRVRIMSYPEPFNFAAMVNAGVAAARGTIVVLLNNDVAVLEPGWLEAMVRQAARPEIGAVGAKLLYGSGLLQHAGVVVGLGGQAGHTLRRRPGNAPGRLGQLRVAHEVSAVTAACLAVARAKYEQVGGFDAQAFPIDFNDVDFCLRLAAAGYRTIWTPAATLSHLESVSRGPSVGAARQRFEQEASRFAERWRAVVRHDPYYHPSLSLTTFGEDLE